MILGGTTEARQLAGALAGRADHDVTLSLAGRTQTPVQHPVPVRVGGFGGPDGLAAYLADNRVDMLVDATHPYAAQISRNAAKAARLAGVTILALRRAPWLAQPGDRWTDVASATEAAEALSRDAQRRVFLALGRQELAPFERVPRHSYLIRSVDPVEPPLDLPDVRYILGRGPFGVADERDLFRDERIHVVVCKNSGGEATVGKLVAARELAIPVLMIRRPPLPDVPSAPTMEEALAMIDHLAASLAKRGE